MRRTGLISAALCGFVLAGAAAQEGTPAQEPPAPTYDPLDTASCATKDGHTQVYLAYVKAWSTATKDGRLALQQSQKLAEWLVAMDNWMIQTNQTKVHCEQLIAVRKQNGFLRARLSRSRGAPSACECAMPRARDRAGAPPRRPA